MLIGSIRSVETQTVTVEAHSLEEAHALLEQQRPAGFDLANVPVQMGKGTTLLTAVGKYVRRDGGRRPKPPIGPRSTCRCPTGGRSSPSAPCELALAAHLADHIG